ncbi:MAG: tRNA preQ1(34) S-adenosylmethionine ribosyltransferase-isomerase QueA [Planctomycetota bacterium]|jgi:S-adenosylmethionine:tRNA ribosyltransferase-isomerase
MKADELNYELPTELIAQEPAKKRSESRLLVLNHEKKGFIDSSFCNISDFVGAGDCLVLNDTKVLSGRFFAQRMTGGRLEGLFLSESEPGMWEVLFKGAGKVKEGEEILIKDKLQNDYCRASVEVKSGEGTVKLQMDTEICLDEVLKNIGFPPLPPYIKRGRDLNIAEKDRRRYQTVYAREPGAIAAPTAGLHFTQNLMKNLENKGVVFAYITLHVGMGTFKPVTTEKLEEHQMHSEFYSINKIEAEKINSAKEQGGRIIAVGTTSVRTLESSVESAKIKAGCGNTNLFILPGYEFRAIDGMITNFHLPKSTLLALVGAFSGLERIMKAYQYAIEKKYRFYSYGDAMLLL